MTYNPSPAPRGLLDIRAFDNAIRDRASHAADNLDATAPHIPPRPKAYGAEEAFNWTGKALDAQHAMGAGAISAAEKSFHPKDVFGMARKLRKGFGPVGPALTALEEGFGAAGDIQRGVPGNVAIPGAIFRGGASIGAGAIGGLLGLPLGPFGVAAGGLIGSMLADKFLPSREQLGRAVPKALAKYPPMPVL